MRISDWSSDVCSSDLIGPDTRAEFLAIVDRSSPDIIRNGSVEEITVNSEVGAVTVDHSFSDRNSLRAGLLVTNTRSVWDARGRDRSVNNRILFADHYLTVPVTGGLRYDGSLGAEYKRSEEHTSELQSLMRISYAVFCLKKKKKTSDN